MLWVKSFHLIFMVAWFAGIFYLPRLFVYHTLAEDRISIERFKIMERKLYVGIMTPCMVLTLALGIWLWLDYGFSGIWMNIKLGLIIVLVVYHHYCGYLLSQFKQGKNTHSHTWFRVFNEIPVILLIAIVILVTVKPS